MTQSNEFGQPIGAPVAGTFPRPRPLHQDMRGQYCSLVPVSPDHAEALMDAFAKDPEGRNWTYLLLPQFPDVGACLTWLASVEASTDPLYFTVLDQSGCAVGWASYLRIDPQSGSIEVGWINFAPSLQGTRASTEAMFLMMAHAFDDLGYRRYEWKCDDLNAPSRRAALRLGFTYEGTFRQATHYKGRNRDTAWHAILDGDWPSARAEFERWLDPGNFDADGQQKTPLRIG